MTLDAARREFIELWGEMAASWGISKTMAQVYALLYSDQRPFDTDEIMAQLGISRGNANMNLHKLLQWGLVSKVDKPDARRNYFTAEKDVWQLTLRIIDARQNRELKPLTQSLTEIAASLHADETGNQRVLNDEERDFEERMIQMTAFVRQFTLWTSRLLPLLKDADPQQLDLMMERMMTQID